VLILTILQGPGKGKRFELPDNEPQLIGRSSEALPLSDETISRRHAELTPDNGRWYLNDLDSTNGTYVNAVRVRGRHRLEPGDQVRTGNTLLLFGIEAVAVRRDVVQQADRDEMDINVESIVSSNDDSMIMAVSDPSEAAVVQLKVIYELTQLIGTIADRDELLERVMDVIFEYFKADRGFILLQQLQDQDPDPVVVRRRAEPNEKKEKRITYSRTIVQHVVSKGESVLSSNAMSDGRFSGGDSVQDMGIRSTLCVPIKFKDMLYGVIHLDSQIVNYTFTEDQLRLLTAVGVHTGLALANAALYSSQLQGERLAAVGQTVASLSHSIRNIIQGLHGGADVVELGLRKNSMKVVRGGWDIVVRNLDRIHSLTMNMLAYSKQRSPEPEMTNLNNLLEEVASLVQKQFDHKKVALITDLDPHMPPVPIDSAGIHQAIVNLLNNALDAAGAETGAVTMRTEFDNGAQRARVMINDNGVGISEEARVTMFEPFYSTKGLRGTGLGLVVAKKVVQEHEGTITVDSAPGRGTSFTIELPISAQAAEILAETQGPSMR